MPKHDFTINERIMARRKELGFSQKMMAESLGIKTNTYSQMERKGHIICETLRVLCDVLQVSTEYLLYGVKTKIDVGVISPDAKRYEFLEDISDTELKILSRTLFRLKREKRNMVYHYAIQLTNNKKTT